MKEKKLTYFFSVRKFVYCSFSLLTFVLNSETRMTASVLKHNPVASRVKKNTYLIRHRTQHNIYRVSLFVKLARTFKSNYYYLSSDRTALKQQSNGENEMQATYLPVVE